MVMNVQEKNAEIKNSIFGTKENKSKYKWLESSNDMDFEGNNVGTVSQNKNKKIELIELSLRNSAHHIYKLQMTQFAENIKRIKVKVTKIKGGVEKREYKVSFDNTEANGNIPDIILNEKDYKNLIGYREKYFSNEIISSFIFRENCQNPGIIKNLDKNKMSIQNNKSRKNTKQISPQPSNIPSITRETLRNNKDKDKKKVEESALATPDNIIKGVFCLPYYNVCHQCKLQKMSDDLIKCQFCPNCFCVEKKGSANKKNSSSLHENDINNQISYFFIGTNVVIICNKIYYLQNYDDSIKELISNYFIHRVKNLKKCNKYFCKTCLKSVYDINFKEGKKKDFKCPSCQGRCNCSRCVRNECLIKQIAYYLNNYGDIDKLYNFMAKKSPIIEKLKDHLLTSKFVCINFSKRGNTQPRNDKNNREKELSPLQFVKYKSSLEKMQSFFSELYDETYQRSLQYESELLHYNNIFLRNNNPKNLKEKATNEKKLSPQKFLNKKRKSNKRNLSKKK